VKNCKNINIALSAKFMCLYPYKQFLMSIYDKFLNFFYHFQNSNINVVFLLSICLFYMQKIVDICIPLVFYFFLSGSLVVRINFFKMNEWV